MKSFSTRLQPHLKTPIEVFASVKFDKQHLQLEYNILHADKKHIYLPLQSAQPSFKDKLYESTCFEFFWKPSKTIHPEVEYFEWNFSPSLDWACWGFKSYRKSSTKARPTLGEKFFYPPQCSFDGQTMRVSLRARNTSIDFVGDSAINLSCVISTKKLSRKEDLLYYAIKHQGEPDFHKSDLFENILA